MAQKNTSRYAQIRGDFSVYSVDCFPLTSSDSDFQFCVKKRLTQRRKGRGALCPFVLMSKKLHTELTEYTETLLRMFCGCLRRLRETIPLRTALVEISAH